LRLFPVENWRGAGVAADDSLARRQYHGHLPAFEARLGFNLGDRGGLFLYPVEELDAELLMSHLAAAEAERYLDLVAFLEKPARRPHLHFIVVDVNLGAHLDFLDLDRFLFLERLGGLLLSLKLEAAVVEDFHNGRIGIRGDFDEIEAGFGCKIEGALYRQRPVIGAFVVDQLDFADTDFLVGPRSLLGRGGRRSVGSANGGILLYCCRMVYWQDP
jgi:hypothetical protein